MSFNSLNTVDPLYPLVTCFKRSLVIEFQVLMLLFYLKDTSSIHGSLDMKGICVCIQVIMNVTAKVKYREMEDEINYITFLLESLFKCFAL